MSARGSAGRAVDPMLLGRVAGMPRGSQRWVKTALQAIETLAPEREAEDEPRPRAPEPKRPADFEDVLSGGADLREQTESYPELAEELKGIADIVDMLREAGREHRRMGEDILREVESGEEEPEDRDGNGSSSG